MIPKLANNFEQNSFLVDNWDNISCKQFFLTNLTFWAFGENNQKNMPLN